MNTKTPPVSEMFKTQTQKTPRKKRRRRSRNQPGDMSTVDREKHPHKLTTSVRSASCSLRRLTT